MESIEPNTELYHTFISSISYTEEDGDFPAQCIQMLQRDYPYVEISYSVFYYIFFNDGTDRLALTCMFDRNEAHLAYTEGWRRQAAIYYRETRSATRSRLKVVEPFRKISEFNLSD